MTFTPPHFKIEHYTVAHRKQFFPTDFTQHTVTIHQTNEITQLQIVFNNNKQRHHKRQLNRNFTATHRYPFDKQHYFTNITKHFIHTHKLHHKHNILQTPLQTNITLLTNHNVPHHFTVNNLQHLIQTL